MTWQRSVSKLDWKAAEKTFITASILAKDGVDTNWSQFRLGYWKDFASLSGTEP